jgi:hypothetical protein
LHYCFFHPPFLFLSFSSFFSPFESLQLFKSVGFSNILLLTLFQT